VIALRSRLWSLAPVALLATIFWAPALFEGKSIIHGDSIVHGLALLELQFKSFRHLGQLLWADGIYGGHPLFAEGQGAFASPYNMTMAWIAAPLFGPVATMNLAHFLAMIVTGAGVAALCLTLGTGRAAAAFASLAVVFAGIWIGMSQNSTIQGTLMWVPWSLWALEVWLARPSTRSAMALGLAVAMIVLSGYPQGVHGTGIYMALTLMVVPFDDAARRAWTRDWRVRLGTGLLAVLVGIGVSAIQWLPLLELTGHSHRSDGIAIPITLPAVAYLRGLLFTTPDGGGSLVYFPGAGSLLVTVLASLAVIVRCPNRLAGHVFAAFVLFMLGLQRASPLFRLVYDTGIVPGLHYFRAFSLYINIAIIGFALLAAWTIEALSRMRLGPISSPAALIRPVSGILILAVWTAVALSLRLPETDLTNYAAPLAATLGTVALLLCRRERLIPCLMLALLAAECAALRLDRFRFYDTAILAAPASVTAIRAAANSQDAKLFDDSIAVAYAFNDSRDPAEPAAARHAVESISAMTHIFWDLRSMNGALALPMHRQVEAEQQMRREIRNETANPPGTRLIDLLAVRFISVDRPPDTSALRPFWTDPALGSVIMENTAAQPRFQIFDRHVGVASPEEALATILALRKAGLVIENPPASHQTEPEDAPAGGPAEPSPPTDFTVANAESTDYRIDVTAARPVWFFIADADYPGWKATLDGKPVPLFPAQLLGKAVAIPAGTHHVEIVFESLSFRIGLIVSLLSVVATLILWIRQGWGTIRPHIDRSTAGSAGWTDCCQSISCEIHSSAS
jgi:hypothetical protein